MAINVLAETPQAVAEALAPASAGTIVEIVEYHRHRISGLEAALRHIVAMAGNPNAADGCRLIINRAKEALGET